MLSAGCGCGDHEVAIRKLGKVREIDAFDISEASIAIASQSAACSQLTINFFCHDLDTFVPKSSSLYDLALCTGSLHHVKELEHFLSAIASSLTPEGYFVVNEYVGDCYNIYSEHQINIINRLLSRIPKRLLIDPEARVRNATIEQVFAADPSEAVRSALIPKFLPLYFDIELERPFGGCLLHPIYPLINLAALEGNRDLEELLFGLLLEFESILISTQSMNSDFVFYICRSKKVSR